MFANFMISSDIIQPDKDVNQYQISMGNVFKIPTPEATVSLQSILIVGDYQQVNTGTKLEIIMRNVRDTDKSTVIQSSELPVIAQTPSVTFTIGFNNLLIPEPGIYQFVVEINGNVLAANVVKFELTTNEQDKA